jgi:hypothetical protein
MTPGAESRQKRRKAVAGDGASPMACPHGPRNVEATHISRSSLPNVREEGTGEACVDGILGGRDARIIVNAGN